MVCVYVGGESPYPTYEGVADYTEGVTVLYDPQTTNYRDCLDFFFATQKPFGQCKERGQYASGVWWHSEEQRAEVQRKVGELEQGGQGVSAICAPVSILYRAEEYHQEFFAKNPGMSW